MGEVGERPPAGASALLELLAGMSRVVAELVVMR